MGDSQNYGPLSGIDYITVCVVEMIEKQMEMKWKLLQTLMICGALSGRGAKASSVAYFIHAACTHKPQTPNLLSLQPTPEIPNLKILQQERQICYLNPRNVRTQQIF